jgi:LmbE family N-acetylglucosaminyl deacetylase
MTGLLKFLKNFFVKPRNRWLAIAVLFVLGSGLAFYFLIYPRVLPQNAIDFLPDAASPSQGQKVLVFSPHPDDETIAISGYIAQAEKNGARVRIILVTDGNKHHNGTIRHVEFRKATGILGVAGSDLVFLDFPDGTLEQQKQSVLFEQFKKQVDDFGPDIVLYPDSQDFHPDHSTTGKIMTQIMKTEPQTLIAYEYLVHYEVFYPRPKKYAPGLYLLPPIRLLGFGKTWQRFMLSADVEELKKEAILAYASQLRNPVLKELLLGSIRKNELLSVPFPERIPSPAAD